MTKTVVYLRIAAILTFLHAVLHTVGGVFGHVDPGPASVAVEAMKSNQFLLMGHVRNFWEFYRGLGLGITISLTTESIVFWQLALLARTERWNLRPVLATFTLAYLVLALNSYTYFFIGPVIVEVMIAACLGMAIVTAKSYSGVHEGVALRA